MSVNTFQSRLSARVNKLSQKLIDNSIRLAGLATDVILIRTNLNNMGDITSYDVKDIDVINAIFPPMIDIPLKRFLSPTGGLADISANNATEIEPFETYVEQKYKVDQGSIVLKFFENIQGENPKIKMLTDPWILPLKVADVLGTFGARSLVWQKMNLTYTDIALPTQIYNWIVSLATRRGILKW